MENQPYLFQLGTNHRSSGSTIDSLPRELRDRQSELSSEFHGLSTGGVTFEWYGADRREERAMSVGSAPAGGYLVAGEIQEPADALRAKLVLEKLGARIFAGLKSDVKFSRVISGGTATWMSETAAATPSDLTFNGVNLQPKRLTATRKFSLELLKQGAGIEPFLRAELFGALAEEMQRGAICGIGAAEPTGILARADIGSVAGGTNGAAPTYANLCDLEYAVTGTGKADLGYTGWAVSPKVRNKLRQTFVNGTGSAPIWGLNSYDQLFGRFAGVTPSVSDTLTKGNSGAVCSAIVYADWSELLVGLWGPGIQVTADPFTYIAQGLVEYHAYVFTDSGLRTASAAAAMQDAIC